MRISMPDDSLVCIEPNVSAVVDCALYDSLHKDIEQKLQDLLLVCSPTLLDISTERLLQQKAQNIEQQF